MDIGTGKDLGGLHGRRRHNIRNHLIDIVDPGYEYNLLRVQAGLRRRHPRDPLAGPSPGSVRRHRALPERGPAGLPASFRSARTRRAGPSCRRLRPNSLIAELQSHGPLHNTSDVQDRKRLIRAIEIAEADALRPRAVGGARLARLRASLGAQRLRERITQRLAHRLDHGLLEEVRALLDRGLTHDQLIFYGLEYRYVTEHLRGDISREQTVRLPLNAAIHQFAKRQDTWFRRMERQGVDIHWLDGRNGSEANARAVI